jgi:hypothetical protein
MSLKEGEKIKINIGGIKPREKKVSSGTGFLPPPQERPAGVAAPPAASQHAFDVFGSSSGPSTSGGAASDPFAGSFGSRCV